MEIGSLHLRLLLLLPTASYFNDSDKFTWCAALISVLAQRWLRVVNKKKDKSRQQKTKKHLIWLICTLRCVGQHSTAHSTHSHIIIPIYRLRWMTSIGMCLNSLCCCCWFLFNVFSLCCSAGTVGMSLGSDKNWPFWCRFLMAANLLWYLSIRYTYICFLLVGRCFVVEWDRRMDAMNHIPQQLHPKLGAYIFIVCSAFSHSDQRCAVEWRKYIALIIASRGDASNQTWHPSIFFPYAHVSCLHTASCPFVSIQSISVNSCPICKYLQRTFQLVFFFLSYFDFI